MTARQSLGRGFDALIPTDLDQSMLEEDKNRVQNLLITDIYPNPQQPRREFDQSSLGELARSIKSHGVMQPIIVVQSDKGYRIVAGERRWRAAQSAKLKNIPAIVRSLEELEEIELSLIENIQRVDLSPLEQALAVYRLQQQFNLTLDQIAEKLGKAASTVSNLGRLLQLPEPAREALRAGKISEGHARAVLSLKGYEAKQAKLLSCILDNNWSVRQAEDFAKEVKSHVQEGQNSDFSSLADGISTKLGAKVSIKPNKRGGQIIIPFKNAQDLERISQTLQN
jgi:ParB family transcriptional regulator, chromosome partitioning protein